MGIITVDAASCAVHVTDQQGMDAIALYEDGDREKPRAFCRKNTRRCRWLTSPNA